MAALLRKDSPEHGLSQLSEQTCLGQGGAQAKMYLLSVSFLF